jgi:phage terminase large subunit-like protein
MTTDADRDYVRISIQYAKDVVAERQVACRYVKLACKRYLSDLKRVDIELRPKKVVSICKFIEKLKHIKGKWARTHIVLEAWQIFILANVFGFYWVGTNRRRFRSTHLEVPRKNAKSTLTSGVGLYGTALDGEHGAEVYSAATTRDQARIVFADAQKMVKNNEEVRDRAGLAATAHAIVAEDMGGVFKALSSDANSLDGLNVHYALIDEFHAHKTSDLLDVMDTATGSRDNPLIWVITTAGSDIGRPCYDRRGAAIEILEGRVNDEGADSMFALIYTIDEGDDWKEESSWIKANPNYGVSVNAADMKIKAKAAQQSPVKRAAFLTKHLNVWVNSAQSWMSPDSWSVLANKDIDWDEFGPDPCWIGVDLASRRDIGAIQLLFRRELRWYTFGRYYVPAARVEEDGNSMYRAWAETGELTIMDGDTIDQEMIKSDLVEFCSKYDVQNIAYDPFQAAKLVNELNEMDLPTIEIRQTFLVLSEPMKELDSAVASGGLEHDGNGCMAWMMANVVAKPDDRDNIRPVKETAKKKIDGPVALIMAMAVAHRDFVKGSVYDERRSVFA